MSSYQLPVLGFGFHLKELSVSESNRSNENQTPFIYSLPGSQVVGLNSCLNELLSNVDYHCLSVQKRRGGKRQRFVNMRKFRLLE